MNRRGKKIVLSIILASLVLITTLPTSVVKASQWKVTRTGGSDRYETAFKVAAANWTNGSDIT
ncbi:hypothetical protein [uncultured Clostridium sp.]|uniref:hypothetical protein n=1 Tax=uncultured Clostridium sp. TaxID=59620 RepID=UPI0025F7D0D9|nr:hypothetical protein [uncultured Clostridium sp.]